MVAVYTRAVIFPDFTPSTSSQREMPLSRGQEFSSFTISLDSRPKIFCKNSSPLQLHPRHHYRFLRSLSLLEASSSLSGSCFKPRQVFPRPLVSNTPPSAAPSSILVEQVAYNADEVSNDDKLGFSGDREAESFDFDGYFASTDLKQFAAPSLEVKELDELPEQWRRTKLAWLCKELPAHKAATTVRVLNAQRKWIRLEDSKYVIVHCIRIRENETGFRVYKWMMQQHWFQFDFALATKLADYMGKERKHMKCRDIFDDILNQGLVPSESTFHILIVAYLSSSAQGSIEEACSIYNRMIQLGGYKPRLSLHNSLFRALVSKSGGSSKHYLKQAEFIFHNLATSELEIHKDIYGGLIWLHSYQDAIDNERIAYLREEMKLAGVEESEKVLVSILRACSKEGDVQEAERTWIKLLQSNNSLPSQAFVYRMEVYAKIGEPLKSLEIFREMQKLLGSASVAAYHKIIEVLCKAHEMELAESLMTEFKNSDLKPLMPSFLNLMDLYLKAGLHDKLETTFILYLEKCHPNRPIYNIYLESLIQIGNLSKAEEIFNQMYGNGAIGVNSRSCNTILRGYLSCDDYVNAEKIYGIMCQKKYGIESSLLEKLNYALSLSKKVVKKPASPILSEEQREILLGMLLGGLQIESNENTRNHAIRFVFSENSVAQSVLRKNIYDQFHEWLASFSRMADDSDDIPFQFVTISHSYFSFYANQFSPMGRPVVPKLINRWLSPRVLAYWYMYGGRRTSSGDILLKVEGSEEGVKKIVKTLKAKSVECRMKRRGKVFWIGILGSNSIWFWKLVEPFIFDDLKCLLKAGDQSLDGMVRTENISFDSGSGSDFSERDNS